jgi:hypothetical protein
MLSLQVGRLSSNSNPIEKKKAKNPAGNGEPLAAILKWKAVQSFSSLKQGT